MPWISLSVRFVRSPLSARVPAVVFAAENEQLRARALVHLADDHRVVGHDAHVHGRDLAEHGERRRSAAEHHRVAGMDEGGGASGDLLLPAVEIAARLRRAACAGRARSRAPPWNRSTTPCAARSSRSRRIVISETLSAPASSGTRTRSAFCRASSSRARLAIVVRPNPDIVRLFCSQRLRDPLAADLHDHFRSAAATGTATSRRKRLIRRRL